MKSAGAGGLTRDAVEALFQRLASWSMGMPIPSELLPERDIAALIILRGCTHLISGVAQLTR